MMIESCFLTFVAIQRPAAPPTDLKPYIKLFKLISEYIGRKLVAAARHCYSYADPATATGEPTLYSSQHTTVTKKD